MCAVCIFTIIGKNDNNNDNKVWKEKGIKWSEHKNHQFWLSEMKYSDIAS